MDELKHKILGLLHKQGPKIPSMGFSDANYHFSKGDNLSINSKTVTESDRPADQDILESIQAAYFAVTDDFDICRFELSKLPDVLDCDQIQRDFKLLKQQHQVVSKKVLQLILEHQNSCNEEFQKILEVLDTLKETLSMCSQGRLELAVAEKQLASTLSVLSNHRKRKRAQNLLDNLNTIKTLYRTDHRLQELLNEENYAGAIELLQECQTAAHTYKHFNCVAALTNKLQETLEFTEEQLDRVLAQMCYYFDDTRYSKLQAAFRLLGKTQLAVDHLHMHYISAIYNTALNIVHVYVQNPEINGDVNDGSGKKPYKNLCLSVEQENFIPCLIDLCKSLFKIVLSYYSLVKWHNKHDCDDGEKDGNLEDNFNKQYIKQKLEHNLVKIWQDVESKVSSLLLNSDLASYKFEQFVQVLGVVHRLIEVGEEFCGSKSEELQESIKKQSFNYFKNYHAQRIEELKIFLENESWEICPVKHTFDILQLQEFKSMRHVLRNYKKASLAYTNSPDCCSSNHSQDGSSVVTGNYFIRFSEHGTPFDSKLEETLIEEDILAFDDDGPGYFSEDSEEENEELSKDYVDEYAGELSGQNAKREKHQNIQQRSPILTNTTLTVLRQMGNYLQMSRLLQPIAFDIIMCMAQLYDFYLYYVHSFFTIDLTISSNSLYSLSLNSTLKRIQEDLYENNERHVALSDQVDLTVPEKLHGLAQRIVGVESLIFLSKQYSSLQGYLEFLVPPQNKIILQQFFTQSIGSAADLRRPIYMSVVAKVFDLRQILVSMSKINWEVKDVMSQHNTYIDVILREIQIFTMRLEQISSKVHISTDVYKSLWENAAHIITHTLVQGYSDAKKCSNGGRALMQLDFTQFLLKFEKISGMRPVPHREYVENYVKAYYLPENELEKWIKEHSEYSSKHLFGLVSCMCQNNKKSRQRLFQVIEDIEKSVSVPR